MVQVLLSSVPNSYGPSPVEQLQPRQQKKHGRQYSVQLDISDKPVQHEDSDNEEEGKTLPALPATGKYWLRLTAFGTLTPLVPRTTFPQFIITS